MMDMNDIDLNGEWVCRLDSRDEGLRQQWQHDDFGEGNGDIHRFDVPGTTTTNGLGTPSTVPGELGITEACMQSLRQRYEYTGVLWLQRWIDVPAAIPEYARVELVLERVIFGSMAWLDGHYAGMDTSLATAHRHELTEYIRPGSRQLLTIRVDNRDLERLGVWGSSYTNETQSIWNGIVGGAVLRVRTSRISDVQVFPDVAGRLVHVSWETDLAGERGSADSIAIVVRDESGNVVTESGDVSVWSGRSGVDIPMPQFVPWDEFSPVTYEIAVGDAEPVRFGMRELTSGPEGFAINGRGLFLRGNVECCVFPRTGFPPCDEASWESMYAKLQALGCNHVRFHSWCPPRAAFDVADRMGLYLQVEGPVWLDGWLDNRVGFHTEHYRFIRSELERIVREYGNHPSFCFLACGNELSGDFALLEDIIRRLRSHDGRRLYTLTSNTVGFERGLSGQDDYFVGVTFGNAPIRGQYDLDGMVETASLCYDDAVEAASVPLVSHEVGQYVVFPDVAEIDSYDGALEPVNFKAVREDLVRKDLLCFASEYTQASAHTARIMYRADAESMLRTQSLGGVQLLSLQDFPGQKTATVGLLNGFWRRKGNEAIDLHWGPVTPLAIMDCLQYGAGEHLHADIKVSNYGPSEIEPGNWHWVITRVDGEGHDMPDIMPVAEGELRLPRIGQGALSDVVGSIDVDFDDEAVGRLSLRVSCDMGYVNDWDLWVYPSRQVGRHGIRALLDERIVVGSWLDDDIREALDSGRTCLILADPNAMSSRPAGGEFFPVFWSPMHFPSVAPCGMWCEHDHPAFRAFPTGRYADLNWKDGLEHSFSMDISSLPRSFVPLTTVVPNFATIAWRTNLFECRVGIGRLMVCSIDLDADSPSVQALARSLALHLNDCGYIPDQRLSVDELATLFIDPDGQEALNRGHLTIENLRVPRTIAE